VHFLMAEDELAARGEGGHHPQTSTHLQPLATQSLTDEERNRCEPRKNGRGTCALTMTHCSCPQLGCGRSLGEPQR
jgi:catalase